MHREGTMEDALCRTHIEDELFRTHHSGRTLKVHYREGTIENALFRTYIEDTHYKSTMEKVL